MQMACYDLQNNVEVWLPNSSFHSTYSFGECVHNAVKKIDLNQLSSLLHLMMCDFLIKFPSTVTELRCHKGSSTEIPEWSQCCTSKFPHLSWVCSIPAREGEAQHTPSSAVEEYAPPFGPDSQWRSGDCPSAFLVHFRVRTEHWLTTKQHWNLTMMLLIVLVIGSHYCPVPRGAEKNVKQLLKTPNLQPWAVKEPGISVSRLCKAQRKLQWFKELLSSVMGWQSP